MHFSRNNCDQWVNYCASYSFIGLPADTSSSSRNNIQQKRITRHFSFRWVIHYFLINPIDHRVCANSVCQNIYISNSVTRIQFRLADPAEIETRTQTWLQFGGLAVSCRIKELQNGYLLLVPIYYWLSPIFKLFFSCHNTLPIESAGN